LLLKIVPPSLPAHLVPRERLSCQGTRWRDAPFALVQAPPGFGKTMLLAQWRREHLAAGRVVAWLSAQPQHTPARLVQALALSVRENAARPGFGRTLLQRPVVEPVEGATTWLAELTQTAMELVLVVDEAEQLPPASIELLRYLLRNAPPNLRAVVAARSGCELGLDDLVDYGRCAVADPTQLRFELGETLALLCRRVGATADADLAARVHELADGWPLGTQLVLAGAASVAELQLRLATPASRSGTWRDRLATLLLSQLDAADLALLVRLSFVDELHPALCRALLGDDDPGAVSRLERLRADTPVFAAADRGGWLRMHALVREVLGRQFDALPAPQRRLLHERAALWLQTQGLLDAAAAHALEAGRHDLAGTLVERSLFDSLIVRYRQGTALEWVSKLPDEELERRPRLMLAAAWVLSHGERHEQAARLVQRLLAPPEVDAATRRACDLILNGAATFADDPDRFAALFDPWALHPPEGSSPLAPMHANRSAYRALLDGDPALARLRLQQAAPLDSSTTLPYVARWLILALAHYLEGQVVELDQTLAPVLQHMDSELGRRSLGASMLATLRAAAVFERNGIDEAISLLAYRLDVLERGSFPDCVLLGFTTLSRAAAAQGQEARALELLQALHAVGTARRLPRLCIASLAEQVRMHAQHYRADACAELSGRIAAVLDDPASPQGPLWRRGVEAMLALSHGYAAMAARQWRRALEPLARAEALARQLGHGRQRIAVLGLRALALERCGEHARPLLREAVDTAHSLGLVRVLIDAHPELGALAHEASAWDGPPARAPAPTAPSAPAGVRPAGSQALTPKEREVLALLARHLSNREIALALAVSTETVKWHVKNLLLKLSASTRRQIVQRARMLGLLD
jgi:LuxR family maltose regulon positive regulatory protein